MTAMATSTETPSGTETKARRRFRPYQIALVAGGGFAALTAASYVAEQLWAEHWAGAKGETVDDSCAVG